MDAKDSKVPIYIAILVAIILVAAGGYFVLGIPSKIAKEAPTPTPSPTAVITSTSTPGVNASVVTAPATIKCEVCHTDPQDYTPHVNGGKLCVKCHGINVHNIHIGPGTVNLDCQNCHGNPNSPTIPTVVNGTGPGHYSVCENCHAPPPNSTKPSNGNLAVIHLSRGKYCTVCHGTDLAVIHASALANMTK